MSEGSKYGREIVATIGEPESGRLLTGQQTSTGPNQYIGLGTSGAKVEAVAVKALAGNAGTVYITQLGGVGLTGGYPLAKSEAVSLAIDSLSDIAVYVPTAGDGIAYIAIEQV